MTVQHASWPTRALFAAALSTQLAALGSAQIVSSGASITVNGRTSGIAPDGAFFIRNVPSPRGSGGLDPASPEAGAIPPGALGNFDAATCTPTLNWMPGDLGLPPGGNIDAVSDFRDVVPAYGPASAFWPPPGRQVAMSFTVDRATSGFLNVRIESQSDGAASDVFGSMLTPWPGIATVRRDGDCLSQQPGLESDIDSLLQSRVTRYPLFFSVDPPTANQLGVSPADILWVSAPGAPPLPILTQPQLGLVNGDDINALAIGGAGLVFSLSRNSPSALANPLVGSGGLYSAGLVPWAYAAQCNLLPTDDLNGLAIGDPLSHHAGQPSPTKGADVMAQDGLTGATDQTSLWRMIDLTTHENGYHVSFVEVGAGRVIGFDFDVEVRLWESPTPEPLGAKNLVGTSLVTWPAGTQPGTLFHYEFDDLLIQQPFLWMELLLPPSPNFPLTGQVWPLVTDLELSPTFVSTLPQPQLIDLDTLGQPDAGLFITVSGFEDPDLFLFRGDVFQNQLDLTIVGLNSFEPVNVFLGLGGPGFGPCDPFFNLCFDMLDPIQLLGAGNAGPLGVAQLPLVLPGGTPPGVDLMLQALVLRGPGGADSVKTNPVRGQNK